MAKRVLFVFLTALVVCLAVEFLAFAFLTWIIAPAAAPRPYDSWEAYLSSIGKDEVARFERDHFDPLLGWDVRPDHRGTSRGWSYSTDALGSRRTPRPGGASARRVRISSYGDSFTFGNEVADEETFQFFLSELTGAEVLNFGVPGYGTDQALLKLQRHLGEGLVSDVVILGINDSNARRLMNTYRPFVSPTTDIRLGFKPIFVEDGQGYRLLANPLRDPDAPLRAFETAKTHDWFYLHDWRQPGFPYALAAARKLADAAVRLRADGGFRPGWKHRQTAARMAYLLHRFHHLSREHGFQPLVVFIPSGGNVRRSAEQCAPNYGPFLDRMRARFRDTELVFVDVLDADFEAEKYNVRAPFVGHASPYGNRTIARAIRDQLELPPRDPTGAR